MRRLRSSSKPSYRHRRGLGTNVRVAVATSGRFHVLDLARELADLGHEVAFYSFVSKRRAVRFGLPAKCHRGLLPAIAPWLALQRLAPTRQRESWDRRLLEQLDGLIARRLEHCEVFIGMSGLCVESPRVAREKFGARIFIERGSRHVMSQKQILEDLAAVAPATATVPTYAVERELASYALADIVVVPAQHVVESFLARGFPPERLFRNPYGVDLSMFGPTLPPPMDRCVVLHVGAWSMQKGCDLLFDAVKRCARGATLLHVGAITDAVVPEDPSFEHHEPVPQWRLPEFYAKAHVLALASRQEGLSLVQAQALACGLPVLGFATGALPELVTGDAGRLVSYGGDPWKLDPPDLPALAGAAAEILQDNAHFRAAARQRAEEAFGLDKMVEEYLQILLR